MSYLDNLAAGPVFMVSFPTPTISCPMEPFQKVKLLTSTSHLQSAIFFSEIRHRKRKWKKMTSPDRHVLVWSGKNKKGISCPRLNLPKTKTGCWGTWTVSFTSMQTIKERTMRNCLLLDGSTYGLSAISALGCPWHLLELPTGLGFLQEENG